MSNYLSYLFPICAMIMLVRDDHFVRHDTVIDPMEHSAQWTLSASERYTVATDPDLHS